IVYLIALAIPYTFIVFPVDEVPLPDPTSHGAPGVPGLFLTIVLGFLNFKQAYPVVVNSLLVVVMIAISVGITIAAIAASAKRFEKGIKIDLVSETRSSALWGNKAQSIHYAKLLGLGEKTLNPSDFLLGNSPL